MTTKEFPEGLILKAPRDGAPDYVIGSVSIRKAEFLAWLNGRDGDWVNLNLKRGQSGKWYAEVDNWKPQGGGGRSRSAPIAQTRGNDPFPDDDIPFVTPFSTF